MSATSPSESITPPDTSAGSSFEAAATAALADMRTSAKWLIGTIAATGAVVFTGLQLTSLKDIDAHRDPWRLPVAMTGFGLAVLGILGAVAAIGRFLRRSPLTAMALAVDDSRALAETRRTVDGDPTILGEYPTYVELWRAYKAEVERAQKAGDEATYVDALARSKVQLQMIGRVLTRGSVVMSSIRYREALIGAGVAAIVAALGGGMFAVAVAQRGTSTATLPTLVRPATQVNVSISPHSPHRQQLADRLGKDCSLATPRPAVVLEQIDTNTFNVAFLAGPSCRSTTFLIGPADGVVSLPPGNGG